MSFAFKCDLCGTLHPGQGWTVPRKFTSVPMELLRMHMETGDWGGNINGINVFVAAQLECVDGEICKDCYDRIKGRISSELAPK